MKTLSLLAVGLLSTSLASAQIVRDLGRLGPSDVWCQVSTTENGDVGYPNSEVGVLNQGIYELSFIAGGSSVEVAISSDAAGLLDNFLIVERGILFNAGESFLSDTCYQGSLPEFPQARVPVFAAAAMPAGIPWSMLFGSDQATLEGLGWTFTNATVDAAGSATENVVLNDQGTITAVCPAGGAPACTAGTGQLEMFGAPGNEAVVTFSADGLVPGATYTFVAWWDFTPSTNVSITIGGAPNALEIPSLDGIGAAGLALALALAALVAVARRRAAVSSSVR